MAELTGDAAQREWAAVPRSFKDLHFVVVGAYVADCFVNTSQLPAWGCPVEARAIRTTPGGKALNQAVALARLGAQVTAIGAVGGDGIGRDVLATLRRERVDIGCIDVREAVATTICLCFVSSEGDSAIVWHIDDDVAVTAETVRAAASAVERADAALITFEQPVSTVAEAIASAKRGGRVSSSSPPRNSPTREKRRRFRGVRWTCSCRMRSRPGRCSGTAEICRLTGSRPRWGVSWAHQW